MSISKKSMISEAESKEEYLNIDNLSRLRQYASEGLQRLKIVELINKNSKQIIDAAINRCIQINPSIKQLNNDQISFFTENIDIIFRFVIFAFLTQDDDVLSSPELQKTYLELKLKDFVNYTTEIIESMKILTVDDINNFLVKNNVESDTSHYSIVIVELKDYFDTIILTLGEVEDNSENQLNEKCYKIQQESIPIENVINSPKKHQLNTWQRGNRMIVFASGCSFLGGMFGQLPGALIGAIAGAIYGSILKLETDSPN